MPGQPPTFDQGFVSGRASVRPGGTGLWHVSEAGAMLIGEAPEYDLHYVQNLTFRLDLWILFDTVMEIVVASSLNGLENIQRGPAPTSANEPKCSFDPPRESLMQVEPDARVFGAGHRDLGAGIRSTYDWFLAEHAADGELRGMISESEAV